MTSGRSASLAASAGTLESSARPGYEASHVFAACRGVGREVSRLVIVSFLWAERSARASLSGRVVASVAGAWRTGATQSLFVRWFWPLVRMAFVPHGERMTVETLLGLAMAVACVAPTEAVFLSGAFVLAAFLWDRARGVAQSKSAGDYGDSPAEADSGTTRSPSRQPTLWAFPAFGTALAAGVVLMFLVGATLSSVDPARSLYNLAIWIFYLLFFFMAADASFRGKAENVIWPFLSGAMISGLVGVYQKLTGFVPAKSWLDATFEGEIVRMIGTFSNPTFFAEMLGLALPLTIASFLKRTDWRDRLVLLGFAGVQGVAMVLTYSRGAWLGLIVSFCVVAALYEHRLLFLGLAGGAFGLALAPHVLVERLISSFSLADSSNSYRLFIWKGSLAMLKANLLRGIGLGAESFSEIYPEYMIIQTPAPHAHSTYLEILIEMGLFGFLAMAWLFLVWTFDAMRAVFGQKGKGNARWAEVGALSGIVAAVGGHLAQGVIEYTWYSPRVTIVFWALTGMGAGISASLLRRRAAAHVGASGAAGAG